MSDACDFYPADITFNEKACANFTAMYHGEKVMDVALNVPGLHNVSNALAAIALALDLKISKKTFLQVFLLSAVQTDVSSIKDA